MVFPDRLLTKSGPRRKIKSAGDFGGFGLGGGGGKLLAIAENCRLSALLSYPR
jgi:hypothetical protein